MKQLKTHCELEVFELDNEDIEGDAPSFDTFSHWNRDEFVVIEVCGHRYTLLAEELQKAISNCTNTRII